MTKTMNFFRYILIFALSCSFFISCSNKEDMTGATYSKTWITGYLNPETILVTKASSGLELILKGNVITSGDLFDSLSISYNDISYNKYTVCGPRIAIDDGLLGIRIETVESFDTLHPAGSDVSELVECQYISYLDYIQNGYKKEEKDINQNSDLMQYYGIDGAKLFKSKLSSINYTNTKLAAPYFILKFNKEPEQKGKYQFKLILRMPQKQIEAICEYEF